MTIRRNRIVAGALCVTGLLQGGQALAAGFELPHYGVKEMGIAYGGSAALLQDASAVANNPAGLIRLKGRNVTGGATGVLSKFDYDVEGKRELRPSVGGTVPGDGEGTMRGEAVVPHLYYSRRISEDSAVGIGLYVPVGSATSYDDDWAGRYHATETELTAINIAPTFAWRMTPTLSAGVGAVIQRFEGTFENSIDVGYVVADELIKTVNDERSAYFGNSTDGQEKMDRVVNDLAHNYDMHNRINVDSIAFGINLGLLWEPTESTRFGLNYSSMIRHRAEGTAERPQANDPAYEFSIKQGICDTLFDLLDCSRDSEGNPNNEDDLADAQEGAEKAVGPLGAAGGDIETDMIIPQKVTLSGFHQMLDWLAITGGVTWTNWSQVEEVRFSYPDDSMRGGSDLTDEGSDVRRRDLVQPFDWEDTFRYGLGVIVTPLENWTFRAGAALDESPVPSAKRRSPRGPDSDRLIGAVGMGYDINNGFSFDLGYTFTKFKSSEIDSRENPAGTDHRLSGDYDGRLHSIAFQASYNF